MSDLSPRLAALIAAERTSPTGDRGAVRAALGASLGIAAMSSSAAAATTTVAASGAATTIAGKLVVVALTLGAIGGGTALLVHQRASASATAPAPAPASAPAPAPVAVAASVPVAVAVAAPAPIAAPVPVTASVPASVSIAAPVIRASLQTTDEDQHVLLARAWSALSRNDTTEVLALLDRDARLHATGTLTEERDALRVEALRRLGRTADASEFARAFLAHYPDSIHRALVAHALTKESP